MIVFGGTIGAVLVHYPLSTFILSLKMGLRAFFDSRSNNKEIINQIISFADIARKEGLLALDSKLNDVTNPFF